MPENTFATERTRKLRRGSLTRSEEETVTHIEGFGCTVIHVTPIGSGGGWAYTVGIHDTCGQPEVIAVGLPEETAHFLLNAAAERLRRGIDLRSGRHREMVGEVDCEFRAVDQRWVQQLMGWANWYYEDSQFPVLQAVYPDRENRFPEESDFDSAFEQPRLQPDMPFGPAEEDFWASADPSSSLFDWKFDDPPHTRVFVSEPVHSGVEAITYVSHDSEDSAWQFLGDSMSGGKPPLVSCFHHLIDKDHSLEELADLPLGWWAERAVSGEPWSRNKHEVET